MKSGVDGALRVGRTSGKTSVATSMTTKTEATGDRIVPVGDKSCRASFCGGMYLYLTREKIRQRKTKELGREKKRKE